MQVSNTDTTAPDSLPATSDYIIGINYDKVLRQYNLLYKSIEFYWQVGEINITQGWILHISVVKPQIPELLNLLVPIFLANKVAFKIVRDSQSADHMLEGTLGIDYQCKILVIYPNDDNHALSLAKEIIPITAGFKGPSIPGDHFVGGVLYTRFIKIDRQKRVEINGQNFTEWPFRELQRANISRHNKLLNLKYYPVAVIKRDTKGDVIKALYFKKSWKVSTCIIKQGRKCMLFDDEGRDIQDRLSWQYKLHQQLSAYIFVPKAIDYFVENEDAYLVLDYIRGVPFSTVIGGLYMEDKWDTPSTKNRNSLTNHLLEIIKIVQRLHENGFVHRDITPDNFFIDKKRHTWLLDVELMWSFDTKKHTVPFQTGTPGFMSPEQQKVKPPTIKEDIYAVGALMLFVFTNLHPLKFPYIISERLESTLNFLIESETLAKIIVECLSTNPFHRPDLSLVKTALESYREDLLQKKSTNLNNVKLKTYTLPDSKLKETIQMAIRGLGHSSILSPQQCWISNLITSEDKLQSPQVGAMVYVGWHTGVSGPLWLLAIAEKNGLDIESCLNPYNKSWKFISKQYLTPQTDASLYTGTSGVSLALSEAFDSHLLAPDSLDLQLNKFFENKAQGLTLSSGVAGQGIALLRANQWMDHEYRQKLLNSYVETFLGSQLSDGSWKIIYRQPQKKRTEITLSEGVPGMVWFLLHYLDTHPDNDVLRSTIKACNWLLKTVCQKPGEDWAWQRLNDSKARTIFSTNSGFPGLALVLIKAFRITGDRRYSDAAIAGLKCLPDRPHFSNFTFGEGLAGIGELYLEAYKALNDTLWLQRAGWIAELFVRTFQSRTTFDGFWIMEGEQCALADLFTGNAGAIHFLMHYLVQDKIHHPLAPYM